MLPTFRGCRIPPYTEVKSAGRAGARPRLLLPWLPLPWPPSAPWTSSSTTPAAPTTRASRRLEPASGIEHSACPRHRVGHSPFSLPRPAVRGSECLTAGGEGFQDRTGDTTAITDRITMRTRPFAHRRGVAGAAAPATGRGRGRLLGGLPGRAGSTGSATWSQPPTCSGQLIEVGLAHVEFVAGGAVVQSNRRHRLGAVTVKIAGKHDTGCLGHNSSLQRHTSKDTNGDQQSHHGNAVGWAAAVNDPEIEPGPQDAAQRPTYASRDRRATPPGYVAAPHRRLGVAHLPHIVAGAVRRPSRPREPSGSATEPWQARADSVIWAIRTRLKLSALHTLRAGHRWHPAGPAGSFVVHTTLGWRNRILAWQ